MSNSTVGCIQRDIPKSVEYRIQYVKLIYLTPVVDSTVKEGGLPAWGNIRYCICYDNRIVAVTSLWPSTDDSDIRLDTDPSTNPAYSRARIRL